MCKRSADYVHQDVVFGYEHAGGGRRGRHFCDRTGVCQDYAHLAVAFCRSLNIPARYCTGYLGGVVLAIDSPMDFFAWLEAHLDGEWLSTHRTID